jgi:WhiB family redox-sensing transcriptional regulator
VSDWRDLALCTQTDPELFYPKLGESGAAALRICAEYEVRVVCLEDTLAWEGSQPGEAHGVAGGKTAKQRRGMLRGMKVRKAPPRVAVGRAAA